MTVAEPVVADESGERAALAPSDAAAADPFRAFSQTKVFGSLNGIRALCAILVIKSHAGWDTGVGILDTPGLGVELFFCISGFLITTLLLRERHRTGTVSLRNFYARRSLRIFPIYYALILAVLAGSLALAAHHRPNTLHYYRWAFVVLLTYTQDFIFVPLGSFHPCWSLAMEEQFYLVWPTVEKLASSAVRWAILAAVLLVSEGVDVGAFDGLLRHVYHDPHARLQPVFIMTFTPITLGVCIAHCFSHPRSFHVAHRLVGRRWSPVLWLAVLALSFHFVPSRGMGWPHLWQHVVVMFLLASLVVREDHVFAPLLKVPALARLGAISYGLYLYHEWVLACCRPYVDRVAAHLLTPATAPIGRFVVVLAMGVAVAELSFRYFEQPILSLRSRFQS